MLSFFGARVNDNWTADAEAFDYVESINRAIDYVVSNLAEPLVLADVARAARFSPFHFHRVFQSLLGETVHDFVKRVRLERALSIMAHDPKRSLTDVGRACGFASSSDFSRSFKRRYGVPPSAFDLEEWRDTRRGELDAIAQSADEPLRFERPEPGENPDKFEAQVRQLPARTVAYIRVPDPYQPDAVTGAADALVAWAEERQCADGQWLGYMWDDPTVVPLNKCRYDVAVVVDDVQPAGRIGRYEFPPMRVAEVLVNGPIEVEQRAWDWLYGTWLPASRYVPDDQPGFEAWVGRPFAHGTEHFELYAQLPVKLR